MALTDNLIRYYSPRVPTARVMLDCRQQKNGTLNGDYYRSEQYGWSWNFTSTTAMTTIGTLAAFPDFAGDFSIAYWIKPTVGNGFDDLSLATVQIFSATDGILFATRTNNTTLFRVRVGGVSYGSSFATPTPYTRWTLHVGRRTGSTFSLLAPTLGSASVAGVTTTVTHQGLPVIGSGRDYQSAPGYYGPVEVWNRSLSDSEVWQWYNGGLWAVENQLTGQTRRRVYGFVPAGFRAYWVRQKSQIIGGGV